MTPFAVSSLTAMIAAAGFAFASADGLAPEGAPKGAYEDGALTQLSLEEAESNAAGVFARSDRDGDGALDVDEFAALSIVTAELARLNGFIAVEQEDALKTIALPIEAPASLSGSEHARIDAVARHGFYAFAGEDGRLQRDEYIRMQNAVFAASDLNANGALSARELAVYAQRQAYVPTGA